MEYNTQRTKLKINDYGRNIYNLIQYTKTVEDREKRNQMASAIVDIMAQNSPDAKGTQSRRQHAERRILRFIPKSGFISANKMPPIPAAERTI